MTKNRDNPRKLAAKLERLKPLIGIDMCACAPMNALKCHGECRERHAYDDKGKVVCGELYQIDTSIFRVKKKWDKRKRDENKDQDRPSLSRKRDRKRKKVESSQR